MHDTLPCSMSRIERKIIIPVTLQALPADRAKLKGLKVLRRRTGSFVTGARGRMGAYQAGE